LKYEKYFTKLETVKRKGRKHSGDFYATKCQNGRRNYVLLYYIGYSTSAEIPVLCTPLSQCKLRWQITQRLPVPATTNLLLARRKKPRSI